MLELGESSTINLQSSYNTWKLVAIRVPGPGFNKRWLKYFAPLLYKPLVKTIRHLENIKTLQETLKTFIFSEILVFETKTILDCFAT